MPGINDSPQQVEEILELCAEAGAVSIGGICLHLRGEVREVFMDWLAPTGPTWCRATRPSTPAAPTPEGRARAAVAPGARRAARDGAGARSGRPTLRDAQAAGIAAPPAEQASLFYPLPYHTSLLPPG